MDDVMPVANAIELLTVYSPEIFDEVYKAESYASRLSTDKRLLQFTGTKTVKIPKAAWGGLSDYNRPNMGDAGVSGQLPYGYQAANVGLSWEEFRLEEDRGAYWPIEKFDNEESGGVILGRSLTQINRTVFIPEMDRYVFSKIYDYAGMKVHAAFDQVTSTVTGLKSFLCLKALNDAFFYVSNQEVPEENQILFVSTAFDKAMREDTAELPRWIKQEDYKKDLTFTVSQYEGREVVVVVPQRFRTHFISGPGHDIWGTTGDDIKSDSLPSQIIDFILMPRDAAIHVVKYQKTLILEGREALLFTHMDGYVIIARIYHDLFVLDNKRVAIYAHTGGFSGVTGTSYSAEATAIATASKAAFLLKGEVSMVGNVVKRAVFTPGDKIITLIKSTTANLVALTKGTGVNVASIIGSAIDSKAVTITIGSNTYTGEQVNIGSRLATGDYLYAFFGGQFIAVSAAWTNASSTTEFTVFRLDEADSSSN